MIKLATNFDSGKFAKDLEKQLRDAAEKEVRSKLRDLTAKGLKVSFRHGGASGLSIQLDGSDDMIKEAKLRLK